VAQTVDFLAKFPNCVQQTNLGLATPILELKKIQNFDKFFFFEKLHDLLPKLIFEHLGNM
jgi:hypothetical protein